MATKNDKGIFIRLGQDLKKEVQKHVDIYGGSITAYVRKLIVDDLNYEGEKMEE